MSKLTKAAINKYNLSGGDHCPYCGSQHIDCGSFERCSDKVYQPNNCEDCGRRWDDVYSWGGIQEISKEWQAIYDAEDEAKGIERSR